MQTNFKTLSTSAKLAARDYLRAEKVTALTGYIATVEAKIEAIAKGREKITDYHKQEQEYETKKLARAKHTFDVATSTENPDLDTLKKNYDEMKERFSEFEKAAAVRNRRELEDYDTRAELDKEAYEAKIAEYEEKIEAWETGKSKVDKQRMYTMALDIIKSRVSASFSQGDYDEEALSKEETDEDYCDEEIALSEEETNVETETLGETN